MLSPSPTEGLTNQVGLAITELPEDFQTHRRLKKVYDDRRKMIETGENVDWGMAEALAFGTLLAEGWYSQIYCFTQERSFCGRQNQL